MPRPVPLEADQALDYFQRSFPKVTTEEHLLILRFEDIANVFGGTDVATELVLKEPSILRWPRPMARLAFHYLSLYLGPQTARQVVFDCPFLLTKRAGRMKRTLPALLNVFGSKEKLAKVLLKWPMLVSVPIADFYKGMPSMIAASGNPEAALKVSKEAMDKIRKTPWRSEVPECYPALVAIFGSLDEAHEAIEREPLLLKWQSDQFMGRLARLRLLLGKEGAQNALRKAPYFLLHEAQRKSFKFLHAFQAMEKLFGTEETQRRVAEQPELLALGICLERALRFAERKLGSREAVRDNFESVLRRTGLAEHLQWETKQRPRHGYWTPKTGLPLGFPPNSCSWSPNKNPTGRAGPARGQWDEVEEEEVTEVMDVDDLKTKDAKLQWMTASIDGAAGGTTP